MAGQASDRRVVGDADGEGVEPGCGLGALRVEAQREPWAPGRVFHCESPKHTGLDELQLNLITETGFVPVTGPDKITDGQLHVVHARERGHVH
jgi:hypothetical protein